jgi:hypothetical protein
MARWKVKRRSKATKEIDASNDVVPVVTNPPAQKQNIVRQEHPEPKEVPVMEYDEELYTQGTAVKKPQLSFESRKEPMQRTSWEDPCTIERNVDRFGTKKAGTIASNPQVSDQIEKKVDRLIAKKKLDR